MDLTNAQWRTSSRSGSNGACVEVAFIPGTVGVRDTKNRTAGTLHFPQPTWQALTQALAK